MHYTSLAQDIMRNIPQDEKDKTDYYNIESSFYLRLKLTGNYKYYILQEWHGKHDSNILEEIIATMHTTPPLWVLVQEPGEATILNESFANVLQSNYVEYGKNELFVLYKLK